jgi:hypothetical protein
MKQAAQPSWHLWYYHTIPEKESDFSNKANINTHVLMRRHFYSKHAYPNPAIKAMGAYSFSFKGLF